MSREVRMVPPSWQHPKDESRPDRYKPLLSGYGATLKAFEEMALTKGFNEAIEYYGGGPMEDDYMPDFPEGTATHYMMYESTSEGTPISPAFATPEELAHWLADNNASAFGGYGASYEGWLRVCKGGYAPSAVMDSKGFRSGVDL